MAFTPKKIYSSNTPGQAPSSGTELAQHFNDNFDAVKSDLDEKDKKIVQLERGLNFSISNTVEKVIPLNEWSTSSQVIDVNGNIQVTGSNLRKVSPIIPLTSVSGIIYNGRADLNTLVIAFYDENDRFISGIKSLSDSEIKQYNAVKPHNAEYCLLSYAYLTTDKEYISCIPNQSAVHDIYNNIENIRSSIKKDDISINSDDPACRFWFNENDAVLWEQTNQGKIAIKNQTSNNQYASIKNDGKSQFFTPQNIKDFTISVEFINDSENALTVWQKGDTKPLFNCWGSVGGSLALQIYTTSYIDKSIPINQSSYNKLTIRVVSGNLEIHANGKLHHTISGVRDLDIEKLRVSTEKFISLKLYKGDVGDVNMINKTPCLYIDKNQTYNGYSIDIITGKEIKHQLSSVTANDNIEDASEYKPCNRSFSGNTRFPKRVTKGAISIIDDDGAVKAFTELYPFCVNKNIPFGAAVITSRIDKNATHLTSKQLREMQNSGMVEIMSHSYSHVGMDSTVSYAEKEIQMRQSQEDLMRYGCAAHGMVLPNGKFDDDTIFLSSANFHCTYHFPSTVGVEYINEVGKMQNHYIQRISFDQTGDKTYADRLEIYKNIIDVVVSKNAWLVITVHMSGYEWKPDSFQLLGEIVDYANVSGVKFLLPKNAFECFGNLAEASNSKSSACGIDAKGAAFSY